GRPPATRLAPDPRLLRADRLAHARPASPPRCPAGGQLPRRRHRALAPALVVMVDPIRRRASRLAGSFGGALRGGGPAARRGTVPAQPPDRPGVPSREARGPAVRDPRAGAALQGPRPEAGRPCGDRLRRSPLRAA